MKIFITAPFKNGDNRDEVLDLCRVVREAGFEDFCFLRDVENFQKIFSDPKELMSRSRDEILRCDALLIDYDGPGNGRIVELGVAFGAGKRIIMIAKDDIEIKETILGTADILIRYTKTEEILDGLRKAYTKLK